MTGLNPTEIGAKAREIEVLAEDALNGKKGDLSAEQKLIDTVQASQKDHPEIFHGEGFLTNGIESKLALNGWKPDRFPAIQFLYEQNADGSNGRLNGIYFSRSGQDKTKVEDIKRFGLANAERID